MGLVLPEITEQSRRGHLTPLCLCFLICGMEVRLPALQGCSEGHRSCVPRSWHHTWDLAGLSKCGCFLPSLPPGLRGLICLVGMRFPCVFCRLGGRRVNPVGSARPARRGACCLCVVSLHPGHNLERVMLLSPFDRLPWWLSW